MIENRRSFVRVSMLGDDWIMHHAESDVVDQIVWHLLYLYVSKKRLEVLGLVLYPSLHVFGIGDSKNTSQLIELMPRRSLELLLFLLHIAL